MNVRLRRKGVTAYLCTDAGNAELFAALHGDRLRFDHRRKRWLLWRGHWWADDTGGEVMRLAKLTARFRLGAASKLASEVDRGRQVAWALDSESRHRLEAAIHLARSERQLSDPGKDWDSDPWLLGVANGVVNLRTGRLLKGHPSQRITQRSDVAFDPAAQCPRWEQFLTDIFNGDAEMVAFIHRAIGYSLTGDTSEQCLFACYGGGANGKSTLLEVVRHVLGGYAHNLPFSAFELQARSSIPNDVASLVGKRFVTAIETNESVRLNEARVKGLTGSDTLSARFLYGEFFSFQPVAKIWLAFNHKPRIEDDSQGFWRRIRLIPFQKEFKEGEADRQLLSKLRAEAQGVLAWAVRGCLAWQREGLQPPARVKEVTQAYREESDPLTEFLQDRCIVAEDAQVAAADLWWGYQYWVNNDGERFSLDRKAFTRRLQERGFEKKQHGHDRAWTWLGIGLR